MLPSGPVVMPDEASNSENMISVIRPSGVMKAICPVEPSENQTFPSGPGVISKGKLKVGVVNSVITPCGVMRATWLLFWRVNQKFPSGPSVIEIGWLPVGIGNERDRACAALPSARAASARPRASLVQKKRRAAGRAAAAG